MDQNHQTAQNKIQKVVHIQDITPKEIPKAAQVDSAHYWKKRLCNHKKSCACNILTHQENCQAHINSKESFFKAFYDAYMNDSDIVLSPDDIWMQICLQFTKYVNDNSEELRHLFVDHRGQKLLTVKVFLEDEKQIWEKIFEKMIEEIRLNTKNDLVNSLQADYSTTGKVERLMSTAVIMDACKKFFKYKAIAASCGIRNVMFMGLLQDWNKLLQKLINLKNFSDGSKNQKIWIDFIDELIPIIGQFIDTYEGKVDLQFWNKIMLIEREDPKIYMPQTYISGWILKFYLNKKKDEKVNFEKFNDLIFRVPVIFESHFPTHIEIKNVVVVGGFGGVHIQDYSFRPQMSFAVYHDPANDLPQTQTKEKKPESKPNKIVQQMKSPQRSLNNIKQMKSQPTSNLKQSETNSVNSNSTKSSVNEKNVGKTNQVKPAPKPKPKPENKVEKKVATSNNKPNNK